MGTETVGMKRWYDVSDSFLHVLAPLRGVSAADVSMCHLILGNSKHHSAYPVCGPVEIKIRNY
jgi:hypothetical protein